MRSGIVQILLLVCLFCSFNTVQAQQGLDNYSIHASAIKGFIYPHSPDVSHLVIDHPVGFALYFDRKTNGQEYWQQRFNYPDIGYSLIYMDYKNPKIGKSIGAMVHYNFYIGKNHLNRSDFKFKLAFGGSYNTNPYDRETNNKNVFLGTKFTYGMQLGLNYELRITPQLSTNTGISIIHFSNASAKKPNIGINVPNANIGVIYRFNGEPLEYKTLEHIELDKKIHYNISLIGGVNSTQHSGPKTFPFVTVSAYADKRLSFKSAINAGLDLFYYESIKESLKYDPEYRNKEKPDFMRYGFTIGHELFISRLSILTQLGIYIYQPYDLFAPIYQRFAMKYYFSKKIFGSFALKTHYGTAESAEWGIGIKL